MSPAPWAINSQLMSGAQWNGDRSGPRVLLTHAASADGIHQARDTGEQVAYPIRDLQNLSVRRNCMAWVGVRALPEY